jgi:hypothetical protein
MQCIDVFALGESFFDLPEASSITVLTPLGLGCCSFLAADLGLARKVMDFSGKSTRNGESMKGKIVFTKAPENGIHPSSMGMDQNQTNLRSRLIAKLTLK